MKKIILFAAAALVFLTAGCGKDGKGAETNTAVIYEDLALYRALVSMNTNRVNELIAAGYNVNEAYTTNLVLTNTEGAVTNIVLKTSPLQVAVMKWDVATTSNLIIRGAFPEDGLVVIAAERTNLALVEFLVKIVKLKTEPSDPETGNLTVRWTAMHIASMYGMKEIAGFLANNGANIDIEDPSNQLTPLHLACSNKQFEIVKILVKKGALINPTDKYGATPLTYTSDNTIREYLISKGGFDPELPE
ncbi:MAG: hypothetical protein A2Y33_01660 [Spirochaetes bacterium GWF1_51_8]|nr:MAG: hypothetical protein A2Y33_01660 [Spirochaetes bacterium GWF1_51_8]